MRRWVIALVGSALATAALAGDLKSMLSADRPEDRAILRYLEKAEAKSATAADLTELGVLLATTDRLADAEHWLRRAVKADKHSLAAWYRLGLVQQRLGRCDDAAHSLARALRENENDAYARFMLGLARERCGDTHGAIAEYTRAFLVMPELANAEKNPLVLDSKLQTAANLAAYRQRQKATTMPIAAVDPAAVKAMMAVRPTPVPAPAPTPAAAVVPAPETIVVPTPIPAPTPRPTPPAGPPGVPAPGTPPTR